MAWLSRIFFRLVLVVILATLGLLVHGSTKAMTDHREVAAASTQLAEHIEQLKQDNLILKMEKERLVSDMAYYEQLGRELFGLIKADETVFIVTLP